MATKTTMMIQARVGSSRLPRKVLAKIQNKPMIWHVINRAKKVKNVKQIVLLTTTKNSEQALLQIAKKKNILGYAGSELDVLDRFYKASLEFSADPIIRITGDCPLIDPLLIEKMIEFYNNNNYDLISNTIIPTFPDGLDTSVFSFSVLKKTWKNAKLKSEREHVVPYIIKNKQKFKIFNYKNSQDLSHLRWTVDEKADLKFVRKIYSLMKPKKIFYTENILHLIRKNPSLLKINSRIKRDEGYLKSLKNDSKSNNASIFQFLV